MKSLSFVCNYCAGSFCSEHRFPEAHGCAGNLKKPVIGTEPPSAFSRVEVRDIVIAWVALGVAFYFAYHGFDVGVATGLLISLATVGSGFVLHELSHKFVAGKYGYLAQFRMWPIGVLITLGTSLIGFIFAALGATYISGSSVSNSRNGKISVAGPLTNVVVALVFLPFWLFAAGSLGLLGFVGFSVNMFLAVFNMLPIKPLDGAKVFSWKKLYWFGVFAPLAVLNFFLIFR